MSQGKRAALAFTLIAVGYGLMVLAYDKPEWYFEMCGIVGAIVFLASLIWWIISGTSAFKHERTRARMGVDA